MSSSSGLQKAIEKLNSAGLTRVASIRAYPKLQRRKETAFSKSSHTYKPPRGRVFRIGALHRKPFTPESLLRNRRGYVNAQLNSVAHAPSLYHWLYHRCGIPFEETLRLIENDGLKVNGSIIRDERDAEVQMAWSTWKNMSIEVRTENPRAVAAVQAAVSTEAPCSSSDVPNDNPFASGVFVPALHRALHRRYYFQYIHRGVSISSDLGDPRSFIHRLALHSGTFASNSPVALGFNVLRPIGFMNGMHGLAISTNDVSIVRYWNNESLGNTGIFDVRFRAGTPVEVIQKAKLSIGKALESVEQQLPAALSGTPNAQRGGEGPEGPLSTPVFPRASSTLSAMCQVSLKSVPPPATDVVQVAHAGLQRHANTNFTLSQEARIVVQTPLFPYREARKLQRVGAMIYLTHSGPFVLPATLPMDREAGGDGGVRELSVEELALLFSFERKLKVNRMILSLREFDDSNKEE